MHWRNTTHLQPLARRSLAARPRWSSAVVNAASPARWFEVLERRSHLSVSSDLADDVLGLEGGSTSVLDLEHTPTAPAPSPQSQPLGASGASEVDESSIDNEMPALSGQMPVGDPDSGQTATPTRSRADFRFALRPGNGFTGPTAQPPAVGNPGDFGYDAKAIARWDVVPFQTFTGRFEIGVVAFHINGIDRVDFAVNGGDWTSVRHMTFNRQTNVNEYTITLNAADFADGQIEVRAIAWPTVGEPRVLAGDFNGSVVDSVTGLSQAASSRGEHSLILYANSNRTLSSKTVYMAQSGSDANSGLSPDAPVKTLDRAFRVVRTGGSPHQATIVVTEPGDYSLPFYSSGNDSFGSVRTNTPGWVSIKAADHLGDRDVVISNTTRALVRPRVDRLALDRVAVDFGSVAQFYMDSPIWFDRTHWFDRAGTATVYAGMSVPIRGIGYATNSTAEHLIYGFSGLALARNVSTDRVDGDVFSNTKLLINAHAANVIGTGGSGWHSDIWQHFGHNRNVIAYGLTSENLQDVQSIFLDHYQSSHVDFALVNASFANTYSTQNATNNGGAPFSQLNAAHRNVLFQNVNLSQQKLIFRTDFTGDKQFTAENVVFDDSQFHQSFNPNAVPAGVFVR